MAEMTRRDVLKIAAAGAAAALPGVVPSPAHSQGTQKRELVVAQGGDVAQFDPHMSTSSNDIRVSFNLFDNLTSRRPDGKLAPGLATEWKLQGQTTWVFKVRQGVKWHNGDPFSSADAKFSIERTYDPNAKMRVSTVFTTVERIEAPDAAALLKGEVDLITQVPPDQGERIKAHASTVVSGALYGGLYVLAVNSGRPPLDNPLVKQALSLAIDREVIVKELWRGRGVVPSGPIAKGDNHFDPSLPALAYDPKEARERLRKAGYKNEEIVIETTAGYMAGDKPMAEAVQAMWRDAGVNAKVEVLEYSVRAQKNRDKSFKGVWWSDPTSTLRDPDGMMWRLLGPGAPQDYWRHPEFDELGNAARFSVDEKFRADAYRKMTKISLEHFPWIPVIQPYEDYGLQKRVEWTPDPLQQLEIRRFNFKFRRA